MAVGAQGGERSALLGVLHEEVSRSGLWLACESRRGHMLCLLQGHVGGHGKQGDHFDISSAVFVKTDEAERNAKALCDTLMKCKSQGQ